jgi:hypothetical protein
MDEPRVRTYDRHGEPHDEVLRTRSGRVVTEEELAAWAEEAAEVDGAEVQVTVAPTNTYMRQVAEAFLAGGARDRQAAKHLAHYVLALTEPEEPSPPPGRMGGSGPGSYHWA